MLLMLWLATCDVIKLCGRRIRSIRIGGGASLSMVKLDVGDWGDIIGDNGMDVAEEGVDE